MLQFLKKKLFKKAEYPTYVDIEEDGDVSIARPPTENLQEPLTTLRRPNMDEDEILDRFSVFVFGDRVETKHSIPQMNIPKGTTGTVTYAKDGLFTVTWDDNKFPDLIGEEQYDYANVLRKIEQTIDDIFSDEEVINDVTGTKPVIKNIFSDEEIIEDISKESL